MPTKTFFRLRDEKQEAILRSAIREFSEKGYTRAKVGDIAENAGVSKASIFQYFEDKKELFTYCAEWSLALMMKRIDEQAHLGDMDIFDYYKDTSAQVNVVGDERELSAFLQVVMNEPGLLDDSMKHMFNVGNPYIEKLVENGRSRGTLRTDIDLKLMTEFFTAVSVYFKQRWVRLYIPDLTGPPDEKAIQAIKKETEQMLCMIKEGIGRLA